jgi:hypothetical protein
MEHIKMKLTKLVLETMDQGLVNEGQVAYFAKGINEAF